MSNQSDYRDLLSLFEKERVEYLVVGAHAVTYYTEPRFTKDLDLLVRPTPDNAQRVWQALGEFGAPLQSVKPEDFSNPQLIYQIGVEPIRVDIIMSIKGVSFADAWASRVPSTFEGVPVNILGKAELIRNKQAVDRPQDRLDVDRLKGC